jgi:RNA polymerase sigma-70 factor (ECF subfamily)
MDGREPPVSDSDECAFRRLFELRFEELYRFAYRYVQSSEMAKDLVQEAFLRLWRQRSQVNLGGPTTRSYLYTIVRYQALDHLRRRRVEDRWESECAALLIAAPETALSPDPDQEFTQREISTRVLRAVEALPQRQRQVILLRWQQQASYDEIAETLGISPKTVAVHLSRAMQRLREILAQVP